MTALSVARQRNEVDPAAWLGPWLDRLWVAVRAVVAERGHTDPDVDDPHRGMFLTSDGAHRVAAENHPDGTAPLPVRELDPDSVPGRLIDRFGLSTVEFSFLVAALGPDLDPRLERLYGYLNDDLARRRATIGLLLDLHGLPALGPARFCFDAAAPLIAGGLLELEEEHRPVLSRELRVPDVVIAHLLGHRLTDPALHGLLAPVPDPPVVAEPRAAAALAAGIDLLYLSGMDDGPGTGAGLLAATGRPALALDLRTADRYPPEAPAAVLRAARLTGAGLVLGPVDALDAEHPDRVALLERVSTLAARSDLPAVPVLLYGAGFWDPRWLRRSPVPIPVAVPEAALRAEHWRDALHRATGQRPGDELVAPLASLALGPDQVSAAAASAAGMAAADGGVLTAGHLWAGVRAQNGAGLARLARRITPAVGQQDLVLPEATRRSLAELTRRARHRDTVLRRWRMRPGGGRGHGVTALFAGESGTGKTMSAEVLAAELGVDLYVVDLSTVVDKYVGQTEKNLERIFTEAAGVAGVLLFDEADAIFGKRSEVSGANDRYANLESAYLLTRMETFDGIAVLTTNLRSNLDEAFTRRLDVITDFPMPEPAQRLLLWDACLGRELTRAADLDLGLCAERFELSGGSIRSAAVTAAYLAAESGAPLSMADLITAIAAEYRKLGRLILGSEFGAWLPS